MRRRQKGVHGTNHAGALAAARKSAVPDHHDAIASRIASGHLSRERSCDGKTRFKSYEFATMAAAAIGAKAAKQFRVYACPFCNGFHMASVAGIAS